MKLNSKKLTVLVVFSLVWLGGRYVTGPVAAQVNEPSREGVEFFEKKIRPVLEANCYLCHSSKTQAPQGGLALDTRAGTLKGGASGQAAVVPGAPEKSLLLTAIRHTDPKLKMPPMGPLTEAQIKDFETWIKLGAPDPRTETAAAPARQPYDFTEARKFWSFQPVKEPALPAVKNHRWIKSPVDQFILAKLEEKQLKPVQPAAKRTLIRRATFDLTGLPPTPAEIDDFLKDTSDQAFAKVVDRLLASRQYGERWGRHWLDVVRYADTSGCNSDFPIPAAYKYRNYVIESFNRDKPYDQFIREQVAGDLLPAKSEAERQEGIIATGYLALSRRFGSRNNEFHLTIDDTIDNVGRAVLGLSISCARCHDHKFDPIPTQDYYALYGIFNSTRYAFPGTEIYRHTKDFVPLAPAEEGAKLIKWQNELAELDDRHENLIVEKAQLERKAKAAQESAEKASKEGKETKEVKEVKEVKAEKPVTTPPARTLEQVKAELAEVKVRMAELENQPPKIEKAYAVAEGKAANAPIFRKGEPKNKGEVVPRGFLQILGGQRLPSEETGSGRRQLAQWLTEPTNPLTARVMVNRIWQYHFGKGLVQTPNDFGARGKAPTHPELLDYLATRFIASGWSVKTMHKLIMLSQTYQLASTADAANDAKDVNNDYLWRFNPRRLSAEEIRDAMLLASGTLDPSIGEAHPFPPEGVWRYTQHKPYVADYDTNRRSVYLMQQRIKRQPYLDIFDGADTNATTAERPVSTTPIQALFVMNDPFVHQQADQLAVRMGLAYAEEPRRIDYAYRLALGRPATPAEIKLAQAYLQQLRQDVTNTSIAADQRHRAALASLARVLFSSNEFIFID